MDVARMREILKTEYGINSEKEFDEAVKNFKGIDIGIFIKPIGERSLSNVQKKGPVPA